MATTYAIGRALDELVQVDPYFTEVSLGAYFREDLHRCSMRYPWEVLHMVREYEQRIMVRRDDPRVVNRLKAFDKLGTLVDAYQGSPAQAQDNEWIDCVHRANQSYHYHEELRRRSEAARAYEEKYGTPFERVCPILST